MVAVTTYNVRAKRWRGGWELHIGGVGVTQSRTLGAAERNVRDYVETLTDKSPAGDSVRITVDIPGGLAQRASAAAKATREAAEAQQRAAAEVRKVAMAMRRSGLSVADTAVVLGVSKGRVSQLVGANATAKRLHADRRQVRRSA